MADSIKIATWNVNSINAHLEQITSWVQDNAPDVLLLQETKCEDVKFPYDAFEAYNVSHCGQKTYNGVATLSKFPMEDVITSFKNTPCPEQARFIEANISTNLGLIKVINTYIPNGGDVDSDKFKMKLTFLDQLNNYLNTLDFEIPTVIGGDFNVAPFNIDAYSADEMRNKTLFTDVEKSKLRKILNSNFIDIFRACNPAAQEFSWWDYRKGAFDRNAGLRIDFLLANPKFADLLLGAKIDSEIRKHPKCSDHVPVIATIQNQL
jgi:exodeoxyribonuclease-3